MPFGSYEVAAVRLDTCVQQGDQVAAVGCQRLSNVVKVTVTEDCEVNRVSEVEFSGP
ncbi:MAG: hypothetical protein ACP5JJ_10810 [Anaerolineae bacterium]